MKEYKFWKKIRNNRFYLAITVLIGAILLFLLVLYLAVPSYRFADVEPFNGEFIHNPYKKINRINYIDFRSKSVEDQGISAYEYGFSLSGTRYLCLGYDSKRIIDYPFLQSVHCKQHNIDKLNEKSRVVALAHPSKGFRQGQLTHLDHYRVMEALSPNDNSLYYWDIALSNGHRVNIIATTGDEVVLSPDSLKFVTACLVTNDPDSVYKSLKDGNSYAVAYRGNLIDVPVLQEVTTNGDTMFVSVSEKAKEIRFCGQNAKVRQTLNDVLEGFYVFKDDDTYIRTEIEFENGNTLYLNPLVRHQYQFFFDLDKAEVMTGRTYMMWGVYIIVVLAFARWFIKSRVISTESRPKGEGNG